MFGQDDPVPPDPTSNFFASDYGNSHDPVGLGLGAPDSLCPPPVATLLLVNCNVSTVSLHLRSNFPPATAQLCPREDSSPKSPILCRVGRKTLLRPSLGRRPLGWKHCLGLVEVGVERPDCLSDLSTLMEVRLSMEAVQHMTSKATQASHSASPSIQHESFTCNKPQRQYRR